MGMLRHLWNDEDGTVLSAEVVLLTTILIIGIIVGAKSFRDSSVTEWADFAQAIADMDQSYNIPDATAPGGVGGGFVDARDFCDTTADNDAQTDSSNAYFNSGGRFIRYGAPAELE